MTISPAFQPAYDFSDDLQPTVLATGAVEMVFSDGQRCQGTGDWVLIVQPRPKILLRVKLPDAVIASGLLDFRDDDDLKVFYRSKEIKGFLKKRLFWSQEFSEFFWVPESLSYEEGEMDDACTTHVISHVFNFPDFSGEGRGRKVAPPGHKTLLLECEEWRIALQSLAGDATVVGWDRARKEERCSLTHVLKLERIDGKPFSGEAASGHLWLLSWFCHLQWEGIVQPCAMSALGMMAKQCGGLSIVRKRPARRRRGSTSTMVTCWRSCFHCSLNIGAAPTRRR